MVKRKTTSPDVETQLRQAILSAGITRYELFKRSGVSQPVLTNFVSGKRSLTLTTAAKLCKALGLELRPVKKGE